ncbi:MAG: hypothetical protein H0V89_10910 [Deltaproteobacteria bacterium]|nr:hypothetical protein [Deltaproteobacteria bacterium]
MTAPGLPLDDVLLREMVTEYSKLWWITELCRPGDRVVEMAHGGSALLPHLLRRRRDLHSLVIIVDDVQPHVDAQRGLDDGHMQFPVVQRFWDTGRPWPVAGPFDLIVDVAAPGRTGDRWMTVVAQAAEFLTAEGRLVLAVPPGVRDLASVMSTAGLSVDESRGLVPPADPVAIEQILDGRYGSAAATLYRAMRRGCPDQLVDPVVATALAGDAETVLHVCRKWL